MASFPVDDYTPYGYLDTPAHTRNLTPRGVLRSNGAGFRWHYPAYAGGYGGREVYRAGFRFSVGGALDLSEFDRASAPYHSRNLFTFDLARGGAGVQITFHSVGEHALRAVVDVDGSMPLAIVAEYTRTIEARGEWGESGLVGRVSDDCLVLQGFEDGEAFALSTSLSPASVGVTTTVEEADRWASLAGIGVARSVPDDEFVTVLGKRGETVSLYGVLTFDAPAADGGRLEAIIARGKTLREAFDRMNAARRDAEAERARRLAEDEVYWSWAPRLEGDWPEHWRRGTVYDLETVRMMAKGPVGIYRHTWDAMQIQAPRVVLGEAAMDALLLSYADPELAEEMMLGTFEDAPEPNVPCSREDGSYNMVAADGTLCGTAPNWGYPWLALDWLYSVNPDRVWLERIYPRLAAYLDWWLAHRRDPEGWLVYACSWESGQDGSPRFGEQPLGGGHPTRYVHPVDLQAAFSLAARVMGRFATALGRDSDEDKWLALYAEFRQRTDALWNDSRYADFDTRLDDFTDLNDVFLLAPLALQVAKPERVVLLQDEVADLEAERLSWPMEVWTAVEAAQGAGQPTKAAELAYDVCERVYTFWDARKTRPGRTLPGVACEYWPTSGKCGAEGYGWGAFCTHLVLHTLLGIIPTDEGLTIRPNLPPAWRSEVGKRYAARLHMRGRSFTVAIEPSEDEQVRVSVDGRAFEVEWGEDVVVEWEEL